MKKILFLMTATAALIMAGCDEFNDYTEGKITTGAPSNITEQSATLSGTVEFTQGGGDIVTYGFFLGDNPGSLDTNLYATQNGDAFTCTATNLTPNKTYYARAYIQIWRGNHILGNQISFTTQDGVLAPAVSTLSPTNITETGATFSGSITNEGYPAYTRRGFAYGTSENPTVNDSKKEVDGKGRGEFSADITIDNPSGAIYYVRAYATNSNGTTYGNQVAFKLNMPYVELSSGLMVQTSDISEYTIEHYDAETLCKNSTVGGYTDWRLPTIDEMAAMYTEKELLGTLKEVIPNTNSAAYYWSSTQTPSYNYYTFQFTDGSQYAYHDSWDDNYARCVRKVIDPAVALLPVSNLTATGVTLNGKLTAKGSNEGSNGYKERGFVYSTTNITPTMSDTKVAATSPASDSAFSVNISIALGNTYYVRAYATNSSDEVFYSATTLHFTVENQLPQVSTSAATNISETAAKLNGSIVSKGIPAYTERGFVYSATIREPAVDDDATATVKATVSGTATGDFSKNLTGLTTGTTYYARAYATNSEGTGYGEVITFKPQSEYYVALPEAGIMVQKTDVGSGYWSDMNSLCENSIVAGYTDWRLPTKNELAVMYNERKAIGGFNTSDTYSAYYWSSTTYTYGYSTYYWHQFFYDGSQSYSSSSSHSARCVRTLP